LGIGRLLALARIERARALGAPVAALHTSAHFAASRALYRRMGWQRAPDYDFRPEPALVAEAYVLPLS
ncbi:MAG TPA: GNAT family N-acetyltransferase, partial [Gemmatimonadales bacterium]|nr:GNAT family N-acetyltransferase [Gemmatimonadales bacterium]